MASRPKPSREPDAAHHRLPEIQRLRSTTVVRSSSDPKKLNKLLLNVMIERSLGAVKVVMSPENSVEDLIKAVLEIYVKEKRRPLLSSGSSYELHHSQFSLESINPKEKLMNLGSRNFFLYLNRAETMNSSCSDQVENVATLRFVLTKLMDYLL